MKRIAFLTGTRADYAKVRPLVRACEAVNGVQTNIIATGMHCLEVHGSTWNEVVRDFPAADVLANQAEGDSGPKIMSETLRVLEEYINNNSPDALVIHGDRIETLAAATAGALLNVRVGHIEGGEVSGTIDESLRHAVTKLSHLHFVANDSAARRVKALGEPASSVFVIGSPELDLAESDTLPVLSEVRNAYGLPDTPHIILAHHPVTTDIDRALCEFQMVIEALKAVPFTVIAIEPNNDAGSKVLRAQLRKAANLENFFVFPSIRYERFLVLLKSSKLIIGNSSVGIREAPYHGVPSINVGSRQNGRGTGPTIVQLSPETVDDVRTALEIALKVERKPNRVFGRPGSAQLFQKIVQSGILWQIPIQKTFLDN